MCLPGKSLVSNVADGDLVIRGLLLAFAVLCDVTIGSCDFNVVDFCGTFGLVTTVGSGKLTWLGKFPGINFLLTSSIEEGRLGSCI